MSRTDISRFIDVAIGGPPSLGLWMPEVVKAAAPLLEGGNCVETSATCYDRAANALTHVAGAADTWAAFKAAAADNPEACRVGWKPFRVTLASRQAGLPALKGQPTWDRTFGVDTPFLDSFGIMAGTAPLILWAMVTRRGTRESLWDTARTMQRALTIGAARTSISSPDDADAVLDTEGRMLHANAESTKTSRALLASGVRALERARTAGAATHDGDKLWAELLAGTWSVVDHADTDGKRYLLIRKVKGTRDDLTPAERKLLELAATASSSKRIAIELGVSEGTISDRLHRAMSKLGFASRVEFVRAVAGAPDALDVKS